MTPKERPARLMLVAVGIAMAVTAAALAVHIPNKPVSLRVAMASLISLPLIWAAVTLLFLLFLPPLPTGGQRTLGVLIMVAYLTTGVILLVGLTTVAGRTKSTDFFAVAFSLPPCTHLPAGVVCLAYLAVRLAERAFREPSEED